MKKIYLFLLVGAIFLTGCKNKEEHEKEEYVATKSNLIKETNYTKKEDLPLEIVTSLNRKNEEEIEFKVTLFNASVNMHDIKVMVVHNYYNEDDLFPSIGLFNEREELLKDINENIELTGIVKTSKSINKLDLELKIYIEYTDDLNKKRSIYYKAT